MSNKIFRIIYSICFVVFSYAGVSAQDTLSVVGSVAPKDSAEKSFFEAYKKYFTKLVSDNDQQIQKGNWNNLNFVAIPNNLISQTGTVLTSSDVAALNAHLITLNTAIDTYNATISNNNNKRPFIYVGLNDYLGIVELKQKINCAGMTAQQCYDNMKAATASGGPTFSYMWWKYRDFFQTLSTTWGAGSGNKIAIIGFANVYASAKDAQTKETDIRSMSWCLMELYTTLGLTKEKAIKVAVAQGFNQYPSTFSSTTIEKKLEDYSKRLKNVLCDDIDNLKAVDYPKTPVTSKKSGPNFVDKVKEGLTAAGIAWKETQTYNSNSKQFKLEYYVTYEDGTTTQAQKQEAETAFKNPGAVSIVLWIHVYEGKEVKYDFAYGSEVKASLSKNGGSGKSLIEKLVGWLPEPGPSTPNPIYLLLKGIADTIDLLKIPPKYYDPAAADFNSLFVSVYEAFPLLEFNPATMMIAAQLVFIPSQGTTEFPYDAQKHNSKRKEFALICGLWNGAVGTISGVASTGALIAGLMDDGESEVWKGLKDMQAKANKAGGYATYFFQSIREAHTVNGANSPCKVAAAFGEDITNIVTLVLGITNIGKVGKLVNALDVLDPTTYIFKLGGQVLKVGNVAVKGVYAYGAKGLRVVAGKIQIQRLANGAFSAFEWASHTGQKVIKPIPVGGENFEIALPDVSGLQVSTARFAQDAVTNADIVDDLGQKIVIINEGAADEYVAVARKVVTGLFKNLKPNFVRTYNWLIESAGFVVDGNTLKKGSNVIADATSDGKLQLRVGQYTDAVDETFTNVFDSVDDVVILAPNGDPVRGGFAVNSDGVCRGGNCFIAGTPVMTPKGLLPIEQITMGSLVASKSPITGETSYKQVVKLFKKESKRLIKVYANGEEVITTPEHPFRVKNKWVVANNLLAGDPIEINTDNLVASNAPFLARSSIEVDSVIHLDSTATVYNFEVEDFHTYFVGKAGYWVHNNCATQRVQAMAQSGNGVAKTFLENAIKNLNLTYLQKLRLYAVLNQLQGNELLSFMNDFNLAVLRKADLKVAYGDGFIETFTQANYASQLSQWRSLSSKITEVRVLVFQIAGRANDLINVVTKLETVFGPQQVAEIMKSLTYGHPLALKYAANNVPADLINQYFSLISSSKLLNLNEMYTFSQSYLKRMGDGFGFLEQINEALRMIADGKNITFENALPGMSKGDILDETNLISIQYKAVTSDEIKVFNSNLGSAVQQLFRESAGSGYAKHAKLRIFDTTNPYYNMTIQDMAAKLTEYLRASKNNVPIGQNLFDTDLVIIQKHHSNVIFKFKANRSDPNNLFFEIIP